MCNYSDDVVQIKNSRYTKGIKGVFNLSSPAQCVVFMAIWCKPLAYTIHQQMTYKFTKAYKAICFSVIILRKLINP